MSSIILFDVNRAELLPFTFFRPVAEIRCGILTLREKWELLSGLKCFYKTEDYLSEKYPLTSRDSNILIAGNVIATEELWNEIKNLKPNEKLVFEDKLIAAHTSEKISSATDIKLQTANCKLQTINTKPQTISFPWDIFSKNDFAIREDFKLLTKGKKSKAVSATNKIVGDASLIFLDEGAVVECSVINCKTGPVYIGKDAEVMEGAMVRGPFSLGEHAALKMGAKVYGATTIGPHCKVGGEVSNSVLFGYSNKAHDGFLGNSVIAEWCNLGADTNNSNLKNNYGEVKVHSYANQKQTGTGLQFCGLMMGDHSKAGINTMFNTGTVVGVCSNIFGGGFPPKFIPSFAWGGFENSEIFKVEKAIELATEVYKRRSLQFNSIETKILNAVFKLEIKK